MRNNPYINMLAPELMAIIDDTIFYKDTDRDIAIDVYVKSTGVPKCADHIGYQPKAVQRRLKEVRERLDYTISIKH